MAPVKHALLGASSAHRWLRCTPSAKLEARFPDSSSSAAAEGTLAHAIVETKLGRLIKGKSFGKATKKQTEDPLYHPSMEEHTDAYCAFVSELFTRVRVDTPDAILLSEQQVDFSQWVPDGFGTTDTTIIADDTLIVIDFKYGRGVAVSAVGNDQLRLYALGSYTAYGDLYDINKVRTYIFQPRSKDGELISTEELTMDELLAWADSYVRPRALMASRGEGEYIPGEMQCKFCRARYECLRSLECRRADAAQYMYGPKDVMNDQQMADALAVADEVISYFSGLKEYALQQVLNGRELPGYKLVEGRSNRTISDPAKAADLLHKAGFAEDQIFKLRGITDLEDQCGAQKLREIIGDLIVKPEGKPTLAVERDSRPVFNVTLTPEALARKASVFDD